MEDLEWVREYVEDTAFETHLRENTEHIISSLGVPEAVMGGEPKVREVDCEVVEPKRLTGDVPYWEGQTMDERQELLSRRMPEEMERLAGDEPVVAPVEKSGKPGLVARVLRAILRWIREKNLDL